MILEKDITEKQIWELLEEITDPEIPVLSITDLGIVRNVKLSPSPLVEKGLGVEVIITPTYSGCPAMDMITMNIKLALMERGLTDFKVVQQLSPAWTTDWMTEKGKEKLKAYGIAPSQTQVGGPSSERINKLFNEELNIECPLCHSTNTRLISEFGSTACKSLYQCNNCREPFDYFKCH
jgi:ring-1,2-phenylacetyl-CoA epoxidase subunit PaaD